jgi:hypothetical protein
VRQLEGFFDRFMARLIEIAAGDMSDKVSLAAISCLRKTQKSESYCSNFSLIYALLK